MSFFDEVYAITRRIPAGRVASYGQIARAAGNPRAARAVGYALHANPNHGSIPCHRVVNRHGRLAPEFAFGGQDAQRRMLENEGIAVRDGFVDINKYRCCL